MKHIIHLFLVLCLGLNLIAPSSAVVGNTNNQQLLCSSERQLWIVQSDSNSKFIATGLALGFSLEQIKEFGDGSDLVVGAENTQGSQVSSGHCSLCVFDHDVLDIIATGFFTYSQVGSKTATYPLTEYLPYTVFYFRPPNKAPPFLFIA